MNSELRLLEGLQQLQKRVNDITDVDYQYDEGDRYIRVKVPQGAPGLPGKDGKDGKDGLPGKDGLNGRDGLPGKDGLPGLPGKDGKDGLPGAPGKDGLPGKDGVGITDIYIKNGHLHVTLSNGKHIDCGYVVGQDGGNGVSVTNAQIVNNHLIITLSNGKSIDCGQVGGGGSSAVTSVNGQTGDVVLAIPTKTSDLTNDSGFLTSHQDISGKQDVATLETDVKAFINKAYIESILDNGDEVAY